jgi:hypothetical protein
MKLPFPAQELSLLPAVPTAEGADAAKAQAGQQWPHDGRRAQEAGACAEEKK